MVYYAKASTILPAEYGQRLTGVRVSKTRVSSGASLLLAWYCAILRLYSALYNSLTSLGERGLGALIIAGRCRLGQPR